MGKPRNTGGMGKDRHDAVFLLVLAFFNFLFSVFAASVAILLCDPSEWPTAHLWCLLIAIALLVQSSCIGGAALVYFKRR